MHSIALTSHKSRNRIWFLAGLIIIAFCWIVIQTVQAASIYIVDASGSLRPSLVLINNKPVMSYYDDVTKDIMLAVCGDAACTTFTNTIRQIDGTGDVGSESAIVAIGNNPVIAYTDVPNGDLKVAACSDPTCLAAPTITVIDNNMVANARVSMTVVGGNPVISYQDAGQDLSVAVCVDAACSTPAVIRTLDSTGNIAGSSSITVVGGNPIISYSDATNADLKVAACVDPMCSSPPTIITVDSAGSVGGDNNIFIVSGNPLISYEQNGAQLKVAACSDPACSTPAVITFLDAVDVNRTSIALINGSPAIAYGAYSAGTYRLKVATCNTLTCTSAALTTLTGSVDAGIYPSMVNLNNYPAIGYWDNKNGHIRFYYGGDEGYGLTTTPTPSPTITPTATITLTPTVYPTPLQVGTLVPLAPAASDAYGSAVAVSGDTVVVGAPNNDHDGLTDAGKIYIYQWNGTIWALQTELIPSDAAASNTFGATVGIYGNTLIAGAPGDDDSGGDSGSAYIFVRSGSTWSQQAKLLSPDPDANDRFGKAVSISVDSVLVGASGDDQAASDAGAAYVFGRSGTDWSLQQKLMAGDPVAGSMFGSAVDLYADTAVIGAPLPNTQSGVAYVFVRAWNTANWSQQQKLTPDSLAGGAGDHFGASVSVYNETIIVGAPQAEGSVAAGVNDGAINVFNRSNGLWTRDSSYSYAIPTAQSSQEPQLGASAVDVYRETFLAGVPGRWAVSGQYPGAAYVIGKTSFIVGSWLMGTPAANHAQVGASVARDGNTVVVGAPADDFFAADSGAAYIFRVLAPPFQPTASVTPSFTPSPTLTPSNTPEPTATPYTPTSPADSTPGPHFFAVRHPTLTWDNIIWAQGYQIEIDDDPAFGSPISAEIAANTLSYTTADELADGVYYWHVRAKQNESEWGSWSAVETIIVSAP